jgi:hypothetical protein
MGEVDADVVDRRLRAISSPTLGHADGDDHGLVDHPPIGPGLAGGAVQ